MLIERYKNKNGRSELAIILFRDVRKNIYVEAGGYVKSNENVMQTAVAELREESCNLFNINTNLLTDFVVHKRYVCFPLYIIGPYEDYTTIRKKYYDHNVNILHSGQNNVPYDYLETEDMTRFYIMDLLRMDILNKYSNEDIIAQDVYGNMHLISGRTIGVLKQLFQNNILGLDINYYIDPIITNLPIISLAVKQNTYPTQNYGNYVYNFLNNTISYYA